MKHYLKKCLAIIGIVGIWTLWIIIVGLVITAAIMNLG